jgi:hypothetical protein
VRAPSLSLDGVDEPLPGLGPVGALGERIALLERSMAERNREVSEFVAATEELRVESECQRTRADSLDEVHRAMTAELEAIRGTRWWRLHQRLLPALRPLVERTRRFSG